MPESAAIGELITWLKSVDTGRPLTKPLQVLNSEVLKQITPIFYGLKEQYSDPTELLRQTFTLIDDIVTNPRDPQTVLQRYQESLTIYQQKREKDLATLEERAKDTRYLRQATTLQGITLAYFDVRGLNISSGGMAVAEKATGSDVIILIDSLMASEFPDAPLGTEIVIKATNADANLETALAERLQTSEMLFGKGFKLKKTYGGHPGIIASPPDSGSELQPDTIWVALQRYFNVPRYSKAEFTQKAYTIADKLQIGQGLPYLFLPPSDQYSLAQWQMQLTLPHESGGVVAITINEQELPLYETSLTDDPVFNRRLLAQKTVVSEPEAVAIN